MFTQQNDITETRLHAWKLFFDSEQSIAMGRGALVSVNDPRLVPVGGAREVWDVDAVVNAAIASGASNLIDLAELVDLMADNYLMREDAQCHEKMMQDDDQNRVTAPRKAPLAVSMAELDAALDGL